MSGAQAWRTEVEAERAWRNDLYLGSETPLASEARAAFQGLRWWPVDARFRVPAHLQRHAAPRPGRLPATGEGAVALDEVGTFTFEFLGRSLRLLVYEPAPGESDEAYLLVPFRDETTGRETYGAGRYLDLEPHAGDDYVLDFNRAYHPYCAYDDAWACALPPPENRLDVRIEAGERLS